MLAISDFDLLSLRGQCGRARRNREEQNCRQVGDEACLCDFVRSSTFCLWSLQRQAGRVSAGIRAFASSGKIGSSVQLPTAHLLIIDCVVVCTASGLRHRNEGRRAKSQGGVVAGRALLS